MGNGRWQMVDGGMTMDAKEMNRRTKAFTLRVLKLCRALPRTVEAQTVRHQLARCGTSVGVNYRATQRARSKAEFRAKLGVVLEEADESSFWLEVIMEDGMLPTSRVQPLYTECNELISMFVAGMNTATLSNQRGR